MTKQKPLTDPQLTAYPRSRIVVFAREPRLGQVKSRLASEIGDRAALAVYRAMLARLGGLLNVAKLASWSLHITSNIHHEDFVSLCNKKNIYLQQGQDLGARMAAAIQQTLQDEQLASVILIGTDCPALTAGYLKQAIVALESGSEVVLGPAEDGGYVLVGMTRPLPAMFEDIPWGSDRVLSSTVQVLRSLGLNYQLLETLWDVDRPEDLLRLETLDPPLHWTE